MFRTRNSYENTSDLELRLSQSWVEKIEPGQLFVLKLVQTSRTNYAHWQNGYSPTYAIPVRVLLNNVGTYT